MDFISFFSPTPAAVFGAEFKNLFQTDLICAPKETPLIFMCVWVCECRIPWNNNNNSHFFLSLSLSACSFDMRESMAIEQPRHWSAPEVFGSRAKFHFDSQPATLEIKVSSPNRNNLIYHILAHTMRFYCRNLNQIFKYSIKFERRSL